jgi:hypothetical protein
MVVRNHTSGNRFFDAVFIKIHKGDIGDEDGLGERGAGVAHLHGVGDAGIAAALQQRFDREDGAVAHAVAEKNLAHGDGDKAAIREFQAGGDPGGLIDPREQTTAEKVAVLVQISGKNEALRLHGMRDRKLGGCVLMTRGFSGTCAFSRWKNGHRRNRRPPR